MGEIELDLEQFSNDEITGLLSDYFRLLNSGLIVSKLDSASNFIDVNDEFLKVTGYSKGDLIGKRFSVVYTDDLKASFQKEVLESIKEKEYWKGVIKNRTAKGGLLYFYIFVVPVLNANGEIDEYISIRTDITQLIYKDLIQRQQEFDSITHLGNKVKFLNDINISKEPVIGLIDLIKFSDINDCYGFRGGNHLLLAFSRVLSKHLGHIAESYRLLSDCFGLIKKEDVSEQQFIDEIKEFIRFVEKKVSFNLEDEKIKTILRAGIAAGSNCFLKAEKALSSAKEGQAHVIVYHHTKDLIENHKKNMEWTRKLRTAFFEERMSVYKQGICNNHTGKIEKYECLIRYIEVDGSVVSPFHFLEIAKKAKLYSRITQIVIEKSCRFFQNEEADFSINLSQQDIENPDIVEFLKKKVVQYNVAHKIILEFVETEQLGSFEKVSKFIKEMKTLGCRIAIDDFGSGYSNFDLIMKLDIDYLKIDGSIVKKITSDNNYLDLLSILVDFAKLNNVETVAEFVADEEIQKIVKKFNIDYSQGFYFSEPEPIKLIEMF